MLVVPVWFCLKYTISQILRIPKSPYLDVVWVTVIIDVSVDAGLAGWTHVGDELTHIVCVLDQDDILITTGLDIRKLGGHGGGLALPDIQSHWRDRR